MRYTILFVIALIAISGFIAYFGDLLGRKMGKKRLTLWNLRPRHTAIIVTTFTGMLISALALFTLISVNGEFRKVFTRGEQIIKRNNELTAANLDLRVKNIRLSSQRNRLEREVEVRKAEVLAARKDAREAKVERDKAAASVTRLEKEIAARAKDLTALQARTDAAEKELADARARLKEAQGSLADAQLRLTDATRKLSQAEIKLKDTQARLKETEEKLKDKTTEYQKLQETYKLQFQLTRETEVILNQGDEIIRGKITPRQSEFGIQGDLYSLLDLASEKAESLGAKLGANGRAVVLRGIAIFGRVTTEDDLIRGAADTISTSPLDVIVQVVCSVNSVEGEQAKVELQLYVNKLVFAKGNKIAETTIDGSQSEGRILLKLSDFWKNDVSRSAVAAGIIPASGPGGMGNVGPNPEEQVDELFRVLDRVKAMKAPAKVGIYATREVYAADLLDVNNIRFSVIKVE